MKRRHQRIRIEPYPFEQRAYPLAHFPGSLVGEGHRQDTRRRHMPRHNDVCDAVSYHPGFAAASARQNEQRSLRRTHRFALLGVQPFEKIHSEGT
jgi:hypothetical protein